MKLLQITDPAIAQASTESTLQPFINSYLAHAKVQPLTDSMVELIIFQLRERALFADIEISTYYLN